jgi:hypothetical protein
MLHGAFGRARFAGRRLPTVEDLQDVTRSYRAELARLLEDDDLEVLMKLDGQDVTRSFKPKQLPRLLAHGLLVEVELESETVYRQNDLLRFSA